MRWTFRIAGIFFILLVGYTAWPLVDLYRLGRAVQNADIVEIEKRTEIRALRPSIARQVIAAYLKMTGEDAKLSPLLNDFAIGFGASAADRVLSNMLHFEQVATLMRQALAISGGSGEPRGVASMLPRNLAAIWAVYAGSEYRLHSFYASVPPAFEPERRFRLHLQLTQWTWKLQGIELPAALRDNLAERLMQEMKHK